MAPERDRISQLKANILDHILGSLPIKDAAKTAVLSSIWRDAWYSLTQLNFNHHFFDYIGKKYCRTSNYVEKSAGIYVINKVLLQHNGTIRKFVLEYYNAGIDAIKSQSFNFDQWLLLVTRKGVEEIYIHFEEKAYRLPNCIFSCLTLKRLDLYGVIVEPMNFPCILPNVASICFDDVDFGPANLRDCAIDVPVLTSLSFRNCQNLSHLNINAPKLCSLSIRFCSSDVLGKFFPVNLDLRDVSTLDLDGSLKELVKEFTGMGFQLNVEYLKLSCYYCQDNKCDVTTSAIIHLLQLCPKLCKVDIILFQLESMAAKFKDTLLKLSEEIHVAAQTNKMIHALKLISYNAMRSEILFVGDTRKGFQCS